jgi:hypothetical protein
MAQQWAYGGSLRGAPGPPGADGGPGADGISITSTEVNGSGDLVVHYSDGSQDVAGHVVGAAAPILNPETSVQSVADLPNSPARLSAYLVRDSGDWYVYEGSGAANDGKTGYTNAGHIAGATGATGATGPAGRGITGGGVNGQGHLILNMTDGATIDAGVVKGQDGRDGIDGDDGAAGPRGPGMFSFTGTRPDATNYVVGDHILDRNSGEYYYVVNA